MAKRRRRMFSATESAEVWGKLPLSAPSNGPIRRILLSVRHGQGAAHHLFSPSA